MAETILLKLCACGGHAVTLHGWLNADYVMCCRCGLRTDEFEMHSGQAEQAWNDGKVTSLFEDDDEDEDEDEGEPLHIYDPATGCDDPTDTPPMESMVSIVDDAYFNPLP